MNMNTEVQIERFQDVRNWGAIRGIGGASFQRQYQRFLQEGIEIHDAFNNEDRDEVIDAIGDTIVTLINLAVTQGLKAEDCLDAAFGVIELRKGLTSNGDFIRYGKLSYEDQLICDEKQGSPGEQYFDRGLLNVLTPESFTRN